MALPERELLFFFEGAGETPPPFFLALNTFRKIVLATR